MSARNSLNLRTSSAETRLESAYHTHVAKHNVDRGHEISTFQHSLECIVLHHSRIIHSRPW